MRRYFKYFIQAVKGVDLDFTKISTKKAIFFLAIPMILEMVMESLFAVVDIFFVSKGEGPEGVATVGITESVITIIYAVAIGLSMAATAIVARRIGEKNNEAANVAAVQAIIIASSIAVVLGVVGFVFAEDILRLMEADQRVIDTGIQYTRIMFAGNITIMLLFMLNGVFRGAGDASIAMRSLWIANIINIVLDPCLILGLGPFPEMGVTGAAIATTTGRSIGVIFQLYNLFSPRGLLYPKLKHLVIKLKIIRRMLKVGITGIIQFFLASSSWIFLMKIMAGFGTEVVSGYTIAIRIIIFTFLPAWGMANAAATLVGQNLGAGQPDRAEKSVWTTAWYAVIFLFGVSIICIIFAPNLMKFFNTNAVETAAGVQALRIFCAGYVFFAWGMVISQAFNGAGDTKTPTLMNFICFWLIQIPLAYVLAITFDWGPKGVYWSVAISEGILGIMAIILFRRGTWKTTQV